MRPLWVLGGGGHARVVIDAARASGEFEVVGILDDAATEAAGEVDGVPVHGPITRDRVSELGVEWAVVAIGNNPVRAEVVRRLDGQVRWATVVHPRAWVSPFAEVGEGSVIFAMSVVQPGTVIGRHAILNTAATVDHDGAIADLAHIAPGSHLAGIVRVGAGAFLGTGSSVIISRSLGEWSVVGAGAAVVRDLPANVTAVGVPARVIEEREAGWHLA